MSGELFREYGIVQFYSSEQNSYLSKIFTETFGLSDYNSIKISTLFVHNIHSNNIINKHIGNKYLIIFNDTLNINTTDFTCFKHIFCTSKNNYELLKKHVININHIDIGYNNCDIIFDNELMLEKCDDIVTNYENKKIYVSMSTIPLRFLTDDFYTVFDTILNQTVQPTKIIINICHEYRRHFSYDRDKFYEKVKFLEKKYGDKNIIFNFTKDYGPITKFMGLMNLKDLIINPDDIVICVDDDKEINDNMILYYKIMYDIYDIDCASVSYDKNMNNLYFNNHQDKIVGVHTFSFLFKYLNLLEKFNDKYVDLHPIMWIHDDTFLTAFYKHHQLKMGGINLVFRSKINLSICKYGLINEYCQGRNDIDMILLNALNINHYIDTKADKLKLRTNQKNCIKYIKKYSQNKINNVNAICLDDICDVNLELYYYNENILLLTIINNSDKLINSHIFIMFTFANTVEKEYVLIDLANNYNNDILSYAIKTKNKIIHD